MSFSEMEVFVEGGKWAIETVGNTSGTRAGLGGNNRTLTLNKNTRRRPPFFSSLTRNPSGWVNIGWHTENQIPETP